MHRNSPQTRVIPCSKCGLPQKITFPNGSVGIEQRCIGCDEFTWFELPTAGSAIVDNLRRLFAR